MYKFHKNYWVIAIFENFGSIRKKFIGRVFFDHPVGRLLLIRYVIYLDSKVDVQLEIKPE